MSRQILEAEGHEKLVGNRFGVTSQGICNTPKYILVVFSMFKVFCRYNLKFL